MAAATCLTVDQCKSWEKTGKHEFVKLCKSFGAKKSNLWSLGSPDLKQACYEICWHIIRGHLKPEQAVPVLAEITDAFKELPSLLADIFSITDTELSCHDEEKAQRDRFNSLVGAVAQVVVPEPILKERLDQETLENSGLVPSRLTFQQKYVKTKTRLYYKQQKFNLLREESEGYAKLITELNQEFSDRITPQQVLQNIKSLIGCFNLDPNRVIDILLESFECHPEAEAFLVPLFKQYIKEKTTLCHVLGFKFQFYKDCETPSSLYKLAAILLKHELIDLDGVFPHLYPSDSSILDYSKKEMADAKVYARKLTVVNLAEKAEDKKDDDGVKLDPHQNNQKLGLCEALLAIGAWEKAKAILDRMPEFFGTTYKPVAASLCALIHTVMDPLYRKNSGLPAEIGPDRKVTKCESSGLVVDKAHTYRELYTLVFPMVAYLGPYASCDPILLVKIIRLGKTFMSKRRNGGLSPEDEVAYFGFLNILDEVLLPSLSLMPCNCCYSEELWTLLKQFPYELRYRMYGNWKSEMYMNHPRMVRSRADCLEKAKYLMKRLSKENVKPSGRHIGKLSHSNPGILFEYVLSQIQAFDNLIGPVVDSLKFLTNLSYDILIFCIIEAVANPEKERMKTDQTNLSLWMQSLANFAGSICRKYTVELAGLMQYVANQLKAGKSYDLLLMREVVQKMTGIEISEEITNDQLEAMFGGELLKQEGGYFAQVRNTKKSSTRLKDTLLEQKLALSLCLLIAQHRDSVVYKEGSTMHLKLVGKLYDQCQDTLVQFGSFLSMQLSTEEFVRDLPPVDKLVTDYHVSPDCSFFLTRSQYSHEINVKYEELRKAEKDHKDKEKGSKSSSQVKIQKYIEAADTIMNPVVECVRPLQPQKIWEDLSPQFYVTFWSLSMYDISVPNAAYDKQIYQLNAQIRSIDDNKDMAQSKRKKEKDRCNQLLDKLRDEVKRQGEHVQRVMARLKNQRDSWFVSRSTKNETITQFLQLCVFPRCCFTANDAIFCAKFIHILHDLKTPNFSTLICYDRIFCDITYTVTACTENEAHRYGRFLAASLEIIMRWHSEKANYEKECGNFPGFVTVFRKGVDSANKADQLDFENFRHVCHKWHFRITKSMVACIESEKYIQIRNALIVLTRILPYYPRIAQFGQALERRIDRLRQVEKDKRPDIYALAMGYSGQLKAKKSTWVPESEFHQKDKDTKAKPKVNGTVGATVKTLTPGSGVTTKKDTEKSKEKEMKAKKEKTSVTEKKEKDAKSEDKGKLVNVKVTVDIVDKNTPEVKRDTGSEKREKDSEKKEAERKEKKELERKESKESLTSPTPRPQASGIGNTLLSLAGYKEVAKEKDKSKDRERDKDQKDAKASRSEEKVSSKTSSEKDRTDKSKEQKSEKETKEERSKRKEEKREERARLKEEKELGTKDDKYARVEQGSSHEREKEHRDHKIRDHEVRDVKIKEEKEWRDVKIKDGHPKIHRDLQDRGDGKSEKKEKDIKKEERHEKIKLKRSYSPERDRGEREKDREHHGERERDHDRATSVTSNGSHKSVDSSPRHIDERDSKRRKMDVTPSSSKEDASGQSKSRHRRSLSPDKDKERDREKKERKRDYGDHSMEMNDSIAKKRRSLEVTPSSSHSSKVNGDSEDRLKMKDAERRSYHEDTSHSRSSSSKKDLKDRETSPDPSSRRSRSKDREKKKEKSSKRGKKS